MGAHVGGRGRSQGKAEGKAESLLTVLRARRFLVDEALERRIRSELDEVFE